MQLLLNLLKWGISPQNQAVGEFREETDTKNHLRLLLCGLLTALASETF